MSLILPFSTIIYTNPNLNESEWSDQVERLFRRQQAIDAVLNGRMDDDILYDLLAEDDINPHEWAEQAIANIELILDRSV